jgi:flagellar hook-associated protein 2
VTSSPIGSVQGLSSNIQWQDLIDQMMQVDTARDLTPLQNRAKAQTATQTAWGSYSTVMSKLQTAAKALAAGSAFGNASVSVSGSPTTSRALLSARATSSAAPGTYGVQVVGLAAAQ